MRHKMNRLRVGEGKLSAPNDKETYARYMSDIGNAKPLTKEEEAELFNKIKLNNDKAAIEKICKHNLLFVVAVAKNYKSLIASTSLTLEDLISEGNMGLYVAIDKFDNETGNKFISYAVFWIRSFILTSIQNNVKSIRIPSSARQIVVKYRKKESYLEQKFSRQPSTLEVFESMSENNELTPDYDLSRLEELLNMNNFEISLSTPISSYDSSSYEKEIGDMLKTDTLGADEQCLLKERNSLAFKLIEDSPRYIKSYLIDYFGLEGGVPLTFKEIGLKYEEDANTIKYRIKNHLKILSKNNKELGKILFPQSNYDLNEQFVNDEFTTYCI